MIQKGKYGKALDHFDGVLKLQFGSSEDQEVMDCPVPGLRDNESQRIEDGYMEIDRQEMEGVFGPVIDKILRLIQEQFDTVNEAKGACKPISVSPSCLPMITQQLIISWTQTIVLVGGFGSSPYLLKRVEDHIKTQNNPTEVTVLQPPNA